LVRLLGNEPAISMSDRMLHLIDPLNRANSNETSSRDKEPRRDELANS
jgi:hypothetical protein